MKLAPQVINTIRKYIWITPKEFEFSVEFKKG